MGGYAKQSLGDAFNVTGLAAIEAGEDLLAQLGGEQAYAAEICLSFEYGYAPWVAEGLLVLDQRWRIALGITAGQAGEVALQPDTNLPTAERNYGLRVVEAWEGSFRVRTVPIKIRDSLNGKWVAAFLALLAIGRGPRRGGEASRGCRRDPGRPYNVHAGLRRQTFP